MRSKTEWLVLITIDEPDYKSFINVSRELSIESIIYLSNTELVFSTELYSHRCNM